MISNLILVCLRVILRSLTFCSYNFIYFLHFITFSFLFSCSALIRALSIFSSLYFAASYLSFSDASKLFVLFDLTSSDSLLASMSSSFDSLDSDDSESFFFDFLLRRLADFFDFEFPSLSSPFFLI